VRGEKAKPHRLAKSSRRTNMLLRSLSTAVLSVWLSAGTGLAANNTLAQYSTIGALFQGMYDGQMTLGELGVHGGFGLARVYARTWTDGFPPRISFTP
jgi:hypothetical protein